MDAQVSFSDEWRDWSGLPGHLLFDIVDKFTDIADYIKFGRVCISWQNIFLQSTKNLGSPLLLIDPPDQEDYYNQKALYSLSTESVCNFLIQLPHSKICRGSSFGWLITVEEKSKDRFYVQLQNLFLGRTINLPPLDNIVQLHPDGDSGLLKSEYVLKAALSSDPSLSDDFIVMGIVARYRGLAFLKPGNKYWTYIGKNWSGSILDDLNNLFLDVIFFHKARQFYALHGQGAVLAIEFCGDKEEPKLTQVAPPLGPCLGKSLERVYLLEDLSSGELLQVRRREEHTEKDETGKCHRLLRYLVFKFNPVKQNWTEMHTLGGKVAFVGRTSSGLRSASDCPGCVPNCIYYTSEPEWFSFFPRKIYKPLNDGIYNVEDGTSQPHYSSTTIDKRLPVTIWLEPTISKATGSSLL